MGYGLCQKPARYSVRGFTLVELLIVVVIVAIGAAVAVPAFDGLMERNRLVSETNRWVGFLNEARAQAIKRSSIVRVEAVGGTWGSGAIAWSDDSPTGTLNGTQDAGEVFREVGAVSGGLSVTLSGGSDVGFRPSGLSRATSTRTIRLCPGAGKSGRDIEINAGGRLRITNVTCS